MEHLGIQTELLFHRINGEVQTTADYIIVRTPSAPDYYFGNAIILKNSAGLVDKFRLEADFLKLVRVSPAIKHRTFIWPEISEEIAPIEDYVENGYEYEQNIVLSASAAELISPSNPNRDVEIRRFQNDDWVAWTELSTQENTDYPDEEYKNHVKNQETVYRSMIDSGLGDWWGAFINGLQVAHLGLFFEDRTGRFQSVLTRPEFRGKNICRTLVHEVATEGFKRAERLVMIADTNYHAARIYESLGFRPRERMASLCWWPKSD